MNKWKENVVLRSDLETGRGTCSSFTLEPEHKQLKDQGPLMSSATCSDGAWEATICLLLLVSWHCWAGLLWILLQTQDVYGTAIIALVWAQRDLLLLFIIHKLKTLSINTVARLFDITIYRQPWSLFFKQKLKWLLRGEWQCIKYGLHLLSILA